MKASYYPLLFFFCVLSPALPGLSAAGNDTLPGQFRLSLEYGYSQMINDDADTLSQFFKDLNAQLRLASNFILSVSAYLRGTYGAGLFYSRYISRASLNAYALSVGSKTFSGPYTENLSVNYFGPVLGIKSNVGRGRFVFVADIRPGLVLFFDDISYADVIDNLSSPVFGLGGSMAMEYLLKRNFGVGVSLNGLYASIRSLKDASGNIRDTERNISRIDLNLGIKFHLNRKSSR